MKSSVVSLMIYRQMPFPAVRSLQVLTLFIKNQFCDILEGKIKPKDAFIPDIQLSGDDALVCRGRSICLTQMIDSGYDYMLMVDADMVYRPEDCVKIFERLKEGYHLIAANYPTKRYFRGDEIQDTFVPDKESVCFGENQKPVEVKYVPSGFLGVSAELLRDLVKKLSLPRLMPEAPFSFYPFFATDELGDLFLSEDYYFCEIAREAGYKIWLEPRIADLGHSGEYVFTPKDFVK